MSRHRYVSIHWASSSPSLSLLRRPHHRCRRALRRCAVGRRSISRVWRTYGIVFRSVCRRTAHAHANLARARNEGECPGPMCRTGSVSIRPDSCGLLYAPQVLSFPPPRPVTSSPPYPPSPTSASLFLSCYFSPRLLPAPLVLFFLFLFARSISRFVPKRGAYDAVSLLRPSRARIHFDTN